MTKIKHLVRIGLTGLLSYCLFSCVDPNYSLLEGVDTEVGLDMTLAGPIGHSNLNLMKMLPDSFGSFRFLNEGDEIYLEQSNIQEMGNDIVGHLKMYPKGVFTKNVSIVGDDIDPYRGNVNMVLTYTFNDINTNPNERLDSILYAKNQTLNISISSDLVCQEGSYVDLIFSPDELSLNPILYPENKVRADLTNGPIDLPITMDAAMLKLKGGKSFTMQVAGVIISPDLIPTGSFIHLTCDYGTIKPRVTYGYLGPQRVIYETTKKIPFTYTETMQNGDFFLPFYDPQINMIVENNIGIPANYTLDYVKVSDSKTGESVYADFNGSMSTDFVLEYPSIDEIAGLTREELLNFDLSGIIKTTNKTFDREYGQTNRLFTINCDTMEYHYTIRPLQTEVPVVSYFFDDSKMDLNVDTKLLCHFEGNSTDPNKNFYISSTDTIPLSIGEIDFGDITIADTTVATVKMVHINHLPVGASAHMYFIDENNQKILTELERDIIINAAPVNVNGEVTESTAETKTYIKLNYEQFEIFSKNCKGMVLDYRVDNELMCNVWFKSNNWLDVKLGAYVIGKISFKPEQNNDN
ncbi:MAG: hypothetical protein EOL95_01680 [Bacteroidia bacterium]|nr:hypothetical protein [Bacteroidia bacterium]